MNAQIHLTDTAARIASIEEKSGIWTVSLEWGGPSDRTITDFEISRLEGYLGEITSSGTSGRTGWVILDDEPDAKIGDSIPLLPQVHPLSEAATLPLETEITIRKRTAVPGNQMAPETHTLADWLRIAIDKANNADHDINKSDPSACLEYLTCDFRDVEFEARA